MSGLLYDDFSDFVTVLEKLFDAHCNSLNFELLIGAIIFIMMKNNCQVCSAREPYISRYLGVCPACIHRGDLEALRRALSAHARAREEFDLPTLPPHSARGKKCNLCVNECQIGEGQFGFCGLRTVRSGHLLHLAGTPAHGLLRWYRDPLPTNCVADWVCEGSHQIGYHNLAVFYASCTANCLFCQNWHFRRISAKRGKLISAEELASAANARTFCVCFFGGDPASQMPHALATSKILASRGVRICWETNGSMHPKLLDVAVEYSLETGGCVKFDLKAWNDDLHRALTGISNRRTLENFARAASRAKERPEPPLVIASTLLIPGYVDVEEVRQIAAYIAGIDPNIPYALLAFAPSFFMTDLPCTSAEHASEAEAAAREAGLINVRIGNRHLLGLGWV